MPRISYLKGTIFSLKVHAGTVPPDGSAGLSAEITGIFAGVAGLTAGAGLAPGAAYSFSIFRLYCIYIFFMKIFIQYILIKTYYDVFHIIHGRGQTKLYFSSQKAKQIKTFLNVSKQW